MNGDVGNVRSDMGVGLVPPDPTNAFRRAWRRWALRSLNAARPGPDKLDFKPSPLGIGAPELADRMFRGVFIFDGVGLRSETGDPWSLRAPSDGWAESTHGFAWLEHFAAAGTMLARETAQTLVRGWLDSHSGWRSAESAVAWRPAVVADRLVSWCLHQGLILENAEVMYRAQCLRSLEAQARYLEQFGALEVAPMRRLAVGIGLVFAGLCLAPRRESISHGLPIVEQALEALAHPDGGPVSRAPSDLLEIMTRAAGLSKTLIESGRQVPSFLETFLVAGAGMLRYLRHSDGGLALFNGGREARDDRIDRLLTVINMRTALAQTAPYLGYERAARGRTVVLMDAGEPSLPARHTAHAGALSIEVSAAGRRLIVNCGSASHMSPDWMGAFRAGAAHSTLTINDESAAQIDRKGLGAMTAPARVVERGRSLEADGAWLLAAHEGYADDHGAGCRRRLYLSANGEDLRGEDTLYTVLGREALAERSKMDGGARAGLPYAIRFHLHPDVAPELDPETQVVWLRVRGGELWSFRQTGGRAFIETGVYFAQNAAPADNAHIVVRARMMESTHKIKWGLKRENVSGRAARDYKAFSSEPESVRRGILAAPASVETSADPATPQGES